MAIEIGLRIGRLTVIAFDSTSKPKARRWLTRCDCGDERVRFSTHLRNAKNKGKNFSCRKCAKTKHGEAGPYRSDQETRLYRCWKNMKSRCLNPRSTDFKNYGGKGIRICDAWLEFVGFRDWATSHGYTDSLTIERVDSSWHYDPSNCEWITMSENVWRRNHPGHHWRSMTCDA